MLVLTQKFLIAANSRVIHNLKRQQFNHTRFTRIEWNSGNDLRNTINSMHFAFDYMHSCIPVHTMFCHRRLQCDREHG